MSTGLAALPTMALIPTTEMPPGMVVTTVGAVTTAMEDQSTDRTAQLITAAGITRRLERMRVAVRSIHRTEVERPDKRITRAPELTLRPVKVRMDIQTGEVLPSRRMGSRLIPSTIRV